MSCNVILACKIKVYTVCVHTLIQDNKKLLVEVRLK